MQLSKKGIFLKLIDDDIFSFEKLFILDNITVI